MNTLSYRYPSNLSFFCSGVNLSSSSSVFYPFTQSGDLVQWHNYHPGTISYFGTTVTCTLSWDNEFGHRQQLSASAQIPQLNIKSNSGYNCELEIAAADPMMQGNVRWPGGVKPSCSIGGSCDIDQNAWGVCVSR